MNGLKQNDAFKRLSAAMKDVNGDGFYDIHEKTIADIKCLLFAKEQMRPDCAINESEETFGLLPNNLIP